MESGGPNQPPNRGLMKSLISKYKKCISFKDWFSKLPMVPNTSEKGLTWKEWSGTLLYNKTELIASNAWCDSRKTLKHHKNLKNLEDNLYSCSKLVEKCCLKHKTMPLDELTKDLTDAVVQLFNARDALRSFKTKLSRKENI